MKRLQKLNDLSFYLETFRTEGASCSYVVTQADATSRLHSASGDQVLLARPELHQDGTSDRWRQQLSTAVFVLARDIGAGRTDDRVNEQYERLSALADEVLTKIAADCTDGHCGLLAGLDLVAVDIVPEYGLFGGWNGFSLELRFE